MRLRVRSLALLSGLGIQRCRDLWCRSQKQLGSRVGGLWRRPVATAPIGPLAWVPPYAECVPLNKTKQKEYITKEEFKKTTDYV